MASSIIDALPPSQPRPAGDSPGRGGDGGAPFGPLLSQALQADAAPAGTFSSVDEELVDDAANEEFRLDDHDDGARADVEAGAEASPGDQKTEEATAHDGDEDAVEISDEATAADATAAAEAAAAAAAEQGRVAVNSQAATTDADATNASEIDAGPAAPTPTPTQNAAASGGSDAPTALREFGDVLATQPRKAPANAKHAEAAEAKPASKVAKSKTLEGKPAKTATREATVKAGSTEANVETVADGDESADAALLKKADDASADKTTTTDDQSHDHSGNAAEGGKRPTAPRSSATPLAAAEAAPATQPAGDAAALATASPPANETAIAPVTASTVEPTTTRGAAALARLTAERSIHAAAASGADDGAGGVDRARFVGRVEGAIRAAHQRDGRVHVRLSPPELGALRIELTLHQGALTARVEAETTAARNVLLDNLPALRDRLAQHDVHVERFDVDVRQEGNSNGGSAQQGADERAAREADGRRPTGRRDAPAQIAAKPARAVRAGGAISDAGLDVRV